MNKAELARQLGVSRAYVTMLAKGKRQPSKRLSNRIKKLTGKSSLSDTILMNGVQVVVGSNPTTPTIQCKLKGGLDII